MKLLIHFQNSVIAPLMVGNGLMISFRKLLGKYKDIRFKVSRFMVRIEMLCHSSFPNAYNDIYIWLSFAKNYIILTNYKKNGLDIPCGLQISILVAKYMKLHILYFTNLSFVEWHKCVPVSMEMWIPCNGIWTKHHCQVHKHNEVRIIQIVCNVFSNIKRPLSIPLGVLAYKNNWEKFRYVGHLTSFLARISMI